MAQRVHVPNIGLVRNLIRQPEENAKLPAQALGIILTS
jgi:hypothetical protein